jgi:MoaA/NifB/PqqE/SkfB family radical SAM enzyme
VSVTVLRGPRKWLVDLWLMVRVVVRGLGALGPLGLIRELRAYLRDNRNLLDGSADRYLLRDGEVFAASAMPAVNSGRFVRYLLDEIVTFNHKQPSPMFFALLSTSSRCPYRCRHCYALSELGDEEVVPVDALERTIRGLASRDVRNIFLTGGEVMYRADELPALLAATADDVDAFWLVSTSWRMDRAALEPLLPHKLKGVVISLDGHHEAQVNKLKGHREAFANAVSAIRAAVDLGLLVSVDCMVDAELLDENEYLDYIAFLRGLGVHFVNFFPAHTIGGVEKYDIPTLSNEQLLHLEALMDRVNCGRAHRDDPIAYSAVVWERRRGCSAGQQFLYVDPRGDVRPCPFLKLPAGNIVDTPIEEVIDAMRAVGEQGGCYGQYEGLETGQRTSE